MAGCLWVQAVDAPVARIGYPPSPSVTPVAQSLWAVTGHSLRIAPPSRVTALAESESATYFHRNAAMFLRPGQARETLNGLFADQTLAEKGMPLLVS